MKQNPKSGDESSNNPPNSDYARWHNVISLGDPGYAEIRGQTRLSLVETNRRDEGQDREVKPSELIRTLKNQNIEGIGEMLVCPRAEIICGHNNIEGQRIDVLNHVDRGITELRFKLRTQTKEVEAILSNVVGEPKSYEIGGAVTTSRAILEKGEITFQSISSKEKCALCEAVTFKKQHDVRVYIANPVSLYGKIVRTALGLISVEIPNMVDQNSIGRILNEIMEKDLGIPNAFSDMSEEMEREYKNARYKWQHVILGELTPEQKRRAEDLKRIEVFPGYTTFIENGVHEEYLRMCSAGVRAFHQLHSEDPETIYSILTLGMMSTIERYTRGMITDGLSSHADINSGGGDGVFTRINYKDRIGVKKGALIVFKPDIFDRTDWYCYSRDAYGTTEEDLFVTRRSPESFFSDPSHSLYFPPTNEQVFRCGIGANYIEEIQVSPFVYEEIITKLKLMGLEGVGGKPIEKIIIRRSI